jgi:hypothetical protein
MDLEAWHRLQARSPRSASPKSAVLLMSAGDKSPSQCAGLNRHEAGNARVLRERSSEPLGPEFCVAHREVGSEA